MKTIITAKNPFGADRYGFLWEKLKNIKPEKHLDYGAYDGKILEKLLKTNVIKKGVGIDINKRIVDKSKSLLPKGILLKTILKTVNIIKTGNKIKLYKSWKRSLMTVQLFHVFSF